MSLSGDQAQATVEQHVILSGSPLLLTDLQNCSAVSEAAAREEVRSLPAVSGCRAYVLTDCAAWRQATEGPITICPLPISECLSAALPTFLGWRTAGDVLAHLAAGTEPEVSSAHQLLSTPFPARPPGPSPTPLFKSRQSLHQNTHMAQVSVCCPCPPCDVSARSRSRSQVLAQLTVAPHTEDIGEDTSGAVSSNYLVSARHPCGAAPKPFSHTPFISLGRWTAGMMQARPAASSGSSLRLSTRRRRPRFGRGATQGARTQYI